MTYNVILKNGKKTMKRAIISGQPRKFAVRMQLNGKK